MRAQLDTGQAAALIFIAAFGVLVPLWTRSASQSNTESVCRVSIRAGQASARYLEGVDLNETVQGFWAAVEDVTARPVPNLVRWKVDATGGLGDLLLDPYWSLIGRSQGLVRWAAREAIRIMENEDWNAPNLIDNSQRELEIQAKASG